MTRKKIQRLPSAFLLLSAVLGCLSMPAYAGPGTCLDASNTSPSACQFEVTSSSHAPAPAVSMGVRLDSGVTNVLFTPYSGIPPYYISNTGTESYFIPQRTQAEYQAFLNTVSAAKLAMTLGDAIKPGSYTATPTAYTSCLFTEVTPTQPMNVPTNNSLVTPLTVDGYTYLDVKVLGTMSTTIGPIVFTQTRDDCSQDDENNQGCHTAVYKNTQNITFGVKPVTSNFTWNTDHPSITPTLSLSVNNSTPVSVADCHTSQAPILSGICGPNDGADLTAAPTTGLCKSGDATSVATYVISGYGLKWGWTCNDVQGTITGVRNNRLPSGIGCAACQDRAKQVISPCPVPCGSGFQTVTWYDGCGNVESQDSQVCNVQSCFINPNGTTAFSPTSEALYGQWYTSDSVQYTGSTPMTVSVSGPSCNWNGSSAPYLNIGGGGWVKSGVVSPGQTIQLASFAACANGTTESIVLSGVGTGSATWYLTTTASTLAYHNCAGCNGRGSRAGPCQVGTNCYSTGSVYEHCDGNPDGSGGWDNWRPTTVQTYANSGYYWTAEYGSYCNRGGSGGMDNVPLVQWNRIPANDCGC